MPRPRQRNEQSDLFDIQARRFSVSTAIQARACLKAVAEAANAGLAPGDAHQMVSWLETTGIPVGDRPRYRFLQTVMKELARKGFWPL